MIENNVFMVLKYRCRQLVCAYRPRLRRASQPDCSPARIHGFAPPRREHVVNRLVADPTAAVFSSEKNPGEDARTLLVESRM
jgi:hypothetical protein